MGGKPGCAGVCICRTLGPVCRSFPEGNVKSHKKLKLRLGYGEPDQPTPSCLLVTSVYLFVSAGVGVSLYT
jgi:hypothetical protein